MLRILQIGPLSPPVGGMATVVEGLMAALSPHAEVRVVNTSKTTTADRALWQGVIAQLRLLGRVAALCVGWRPDVVHIHTCSRFTFWRNGVDVVLARLLGRKVVLHIHGGGFGKFLASLTSGRALVARGVLGLAHRVVVLGEGWKELLDRWTDPNFVVVVPNGVPVGELVAIRARPEFTIVCLANYECGKGQADLLRAVAGLRGPRQVRVVLPGFETEPGQQAKLQALAAELGLGDRVEIPGPVTGVDKAQRLCRADCFCLPSYDEGLPMAMLEAMAIGLPVVVTRVGAIPEAVIDDEEGLQFDAGDVPALTAHLQRLMDDPARAAELGRRGRERLIRDFSLDAAVQRLLVLYRELAG